MPWISSRMVIAMILSKRRYWLKRLGGCVVGCSEGSDSDGFAQESPKPRFRVLPGGWIRASGDGKCPVPAGTMIDTIHGNGAVFSGRQARKAEDWTYGWDRGNPALDIVFYRIARSHNYAEMKPSDGLWT